VRDALDNTRKAKNNITLSGIGKIEIDSNFTITVQNGQALTLNQRKDALKQLTAEINRIKFEIANWAANNMDSFNTTYGHFNINSTAFNRSIWANLK
jgi:hypothetical protein